MCRIISLTITVGLIGISYGLKCWDCDDSAYEDDCSSRMANGQPRDCQLEGKDICIRTIITDHTTSSSGVDILQLKCAYSSDEEKHDVLGKCVTSGPIVDRKAEELNVEDKETKITVCVCNNADGCNGADSLGLGGRMSLMAAVVLSMVPVALLKHLQLLNC